MSDVTLPADGFRVEFRVYLGTGRSGHRTLTRTQPPKRSIEPGNVPAPFSPAVEQKDLAQEISHPPKVIFTLIRSHFKLHRSPYSSLLQSFCAALK